VASGPGFNYLPMMWPWSAHLGFLKDLARQAESCRTASTWWTFRVTTRLPGPIGLMKG
jgi:hypothetical protein